MARRQLKHVAKCHLTCVSLLCIYMYILFVTLKKVYDRNVVNKYLLLGVVIYYLIDYIYIYIRIYIFIYIYIWSKIHVFIIPRIGYEIIAQSS